MQELSASKLLDVSDKEFGLRVLHARENKVSPGYLNHIAVCMIVRAGSEVVWEGGSWPPVIQRMGLVSSETPEPDLVANGIAARLCGCMFPETFTRLTLQEQVGMLSAFSVETKREKLSHYLTAVAHGLIANQNAVKYLLSSCHDACKLIQERLGFLSEAHSQNDYFELGDIPSDLVHTLSDDMQKTEELKLKRNLQALADGIAKDRDAVTYLIENFPLDCRIIRERFQNHDSSDSSLRLEDWSPDTFFSWFDRSLNGLTRAVMVRTMESWLSFQVGKSYGSLEANKAMATGIQQRLNRLDIRLECPGGPKTGPCGSASLLRCLKSKGYPKGGFHFSHVGPKRTAHGLSSTFPSLKFIDQPVNKNVKNI